MQQTAAKRSKMEKAIEAYVSFSTALLLRMNIEPPPDGHEDPELDVEAQFSQRAGHGAQHSTVNNKCLSGWCWCKSSLTDQTHFGLRDVSQTRPTLVCETSVSHRTTLFYNPCPLYPRTCYHGDKVTHSVSQPTSPLLIYTPS